MTANGDDAALVPLETEYQNTPAQLYDGWSMLKISMQLLNAFDKQLDSEGETPN